MPKLYAGLDLHSSNVYTGIIDKQGTKHGSRRLPCNLFEVLKYFSKFNKSKMKCYKMTSAWPSRRQSKEGQAVII